MLNRMKTGLLLSLICTMVLGFALTAHASQSSGYFDRMEGNTIVGWGWNPGMPNTAIPVSVSVKNQQTGETVRNYRPTAVTYRSDLLENGIGNGRHGFRITVDWDALPDGVYVIEGSADGQTFSNTLTHATGTAAESSRHIEEAATPTSNLKSLGTFRTTAYCPCYSCSEGWGRKTSTGATAKSNHTIAVDPRVIPYGSKVMINGVIYTAEDRGGGVKGNHIDIFYDTHAQTRQHGARSAEVFLVQ